MRAGTLQCIRLYSLSLKPFVQVLMHAGCATCIGIHLHAKLGIDCGRCARAPKHQDDASCHPDSVPRVSHAVYLL